MAQAMFLDTRRIEIILIGGSAGVLDVLRVILPGFSRALCVPVVIVVHLPERSPALLPQVLQRSCVLPMKFAEDKEPLLGGTVYFAPAGYHLLIEAVAHTGGHAAERVASLALSIDPPVLFSRPAIDVLFESAADAYADRSLAMLLTGASGDGAGGLHAIHAAGGIAVVQAPQSCEAPTMPAAALSLFSPEFVLSPADIAILNSELTAAPRSPAQPPSILSRRTRNYTN